MTTNFAVQRIISTFAPCFSAESLQRNEGRETKKKGVSCRFGFDFIRISQIQIVRQKQSNENASWDVYNKFKMVWHY